MNTGIKNDVLLNDLKLRVHKVQNAMKNLRVDALLVQSNLNNLYFAGRIFAGCTYVPCEGAPLFFVRRGAFPAGDNVFSIYKPEQIPGILHDLGLSSSKHLGLESAELSQRNWQRLAALWPDAEILDASGVLATVRSVKTPYEIALMKKTGSRHAAVVAQFASVYEQGMTDQQWMIEMVHLMLKAGSLGIFRVAGESMEVFMGTVLAGDNGAAVSPYDFALGGAGIDPSYPVGQCGIRIERGMTVMADVAANFYGYLTDCTRVYALGGVSARARDAHRLSIDIHETIAERAIPGTPCSELYNLAVAMAERAGFAECFMGAERKARFVGHGTGLVINEQPVLGARSQEILQAGMCIAVEPKFVIAGVGAVGTEDTYLVTEKGLRSLTPLDREIIELQEI